MFFKKRLCSEFAVDFVPLLINVPAPVAESFEELRPAFLKTFGTNLYPNHEHGKIPDADFKRFFPTKYNRGKLQCLVSSLVQVAVSFRTMQP